MEKSVKMEKTNPLGNFETPFQKCYISVHLELNLTFQWLYYTVTKDVRLIFMNKNLIYLHDKDLIL